LLYIFYVCIFAFVVLDLVFST